MSFSYVSASCVFFYSNASDTVFVRGWLWGIGGSAFRGNTRQALDVLDTSGPPVAED